MDGITEAVIRAAHALRERCSRLLPDLPPPVAHALNPLDYARAPHEEYIRRFSGLGSHTILLGMNPGPWGMGQTGVPFGDVNAVRELLDIRDLPVNQPPNQHPNRPVHGLSSRRGEVSGTRLWGALAELFGTADEIHAHLFVLNHCPLLMYNADGQNITPDKLRGPIADDLLAACDEHLQAVADALGTLRIIGVGRYAERRATSVFGGTAIEVDSIPHPSPANPLANRDGGAIWRGIVADKLLSGPPQR